VSLFKNNSNITNKILHYYREIQEVWDHLTRRNNARKNKVDNILKDQAPPKFLNNFFIDNWSLSMEYL
jgi:hypothetical protein